MNDKEQGSETVEENWWHQYLSEEEKLLSQQEAETSFIEEETVEDIQDIDVSDHRGRVWAPNLIGMKKYIVGFSVVACIAVVLTYCLSLQHRLEQLEGDHQSTELTLESSASELEALQERLDQSVKSLEQERVTVASLREENEEAKSAIARMENTVQQVGMLGQEIYGLKTEGRHGVLQELEEEKLREENVRKLWLELKESLKDEKGFERLRSLIQMRVTQYDALTGNIDQGAIAAIDWEAAGMENASAAMLTRMHYKQASLFAEEERYGAVEQTLQKCLNLVQSLDPSATETAYLKARIQEARAEACVGAKPKRARKYYLDAVTALKRVLEQQPDNKELRLSLARLCQDVSTMSLADEGSGWSNKLKHEARKQVAYLFESGAEFAEGHLILAELDVREAEVSLRERDLTRVEDLLKNAELALERAGGDVVLQSSVVGMRAFLAWDKGYQTSALQLIDGQLEKLGELIDRDQNNTAAHYRSASLLWERSMMQMSEAKASADGNAALEYLASVLANENSLMTMPANRLAAVVLCNLAEIEMAAGHKSNAKQYLIRSEKLWTEMRSKWGVTSEDRELESWCTHQLTLL